MVRLNGYKGHIPSEARDGARLVVEKASKDTQMKTLGYTRLGDYKGSGVEGGKRAYYFSSVAGNSYHQGVMQTIATSGFGVDPRTGYTVNGTVAGRVPGPEVAVIKRRLQAWGTHARKSGNQGEPLMPVYDDRGDVVAYERSMAPEMLAALDRNDHLGEMIGAWAGRQAEEELAQGFNRILVDRLWNVWERDRKDSRAGEFVNLFDQDNLDPVHADAVKLIPAEMRSYIPAIRCNREISAHPVDRCADKVSFRCKSAKDCYPNATLAENSTKFGK